MVKFQGLVVILFTIPLLAMDGKNKQLEFCASRRAYIQMQQSQPSKTCVFCDPEVLAQNYILKEDKLNDTRIMMNLNPYLPFDQGHHLLVMPISHKGQPAELLPKELAQQVNAAHCLSAKLHQGSYSQEYFTNLGKFAGQSVPGHIHNHLKVYVQPAVSLPESVQRSKGSQTNNITYAFGLVKSKLESSDAVPVTFDEMQSTHDKCNCCCVRDKHEDDEKNFIIGRFKHNIICLSHYPNTAGEVAVIPHKHVSAMRDLSPQELQENMALAMALLPKLKTYAEANIRDCDGGNVYTKSMGSEASVAEQKNYHIQTLVMPRTAIFPTPGTLEGNSCKLDFDPTALYLYLKESYDELQEVSKLSQ